MSGDRFSDVDLTFGVADHLGVADVLHDWTRTLVEEFDAVPLVDLERGPITYRVFLLPDALQLDLSMSPAAQFRPAGPRFRLVFGETAAERPEASAPPVVGDLFIATPSVPEDVFGWGVIYAVHARACIERGRLWQAEHYVGAVRDHALAIACLREGAARRAGAQPTTTSPRRAWPDSKGPTSARFEARALRAALGACVLVLMHEGVEAHVPHAGVVAERLADIQVDQAEMPPPD